MPAKIYVESFFSHLIQSAMTTLDTSVTVDVAPANSIDYAVLEIGEANQEMIKFQTVVGLTLGTLLRGLSLTALTDTEVAGNKKTHGINDTIEITDVHYIINDKVSNLATETIDGQKTFTLAVIQSVAAAGATELIRYGEAVKNTWNETIAGIKTFSSIPVGPTADPTTDDQFVRKAYADSRSASKLLFSYYIAGETVNGRCASSTEAPSNTQGGSDANFGRDATSQGVQQAQSFIAGSVPTAFTFTASVRKVLNPTDNCYVEIQTDNAGSPSGTAVTNGTSNDVLGSGLAAAYADVAFVWASLPTLVAGTNYWLVFKRDGANSDTNYYQLQYSSVNAFRSGALKKYTTTWTTNTGANDDACFAITGLESTMVYSTTASYNSSRSQQGHIGFTKAQALIGAVGEVQTHGRMTGFTGATPNTFYYLHATAGVLSTTPSDPIVCKALSATTMFIDRAYINTESKTFFEATDLTGAEAETLSAAGDASALHNHGETSQGGTSGTVAVTSITTGNIDIAVAPFATGGKYILRYFVRIYGSEQDSAGVNVKYTHYTYDRTDMPGEAFAGQCGGTLNSTSAITTQGVLAAEGGDTGTGMSASFNNASQVNASVEVQPPVWSGTNLRFAWACTGSLGTGSLAANISIAVVALKIG
jgi:hypothetical protein